MSIEQGPTGDMPDCTTHVWMCTRDTSHCSQVEYICRQIAYSDAVLRAEAMQEASNNKFGQRRREVVPHLSLKGMVTYFDRVKFEHLKDRAVCQVPDDMRWLRTVFQKTILACNKPQDRLRITRVLEENHNKPMVQTVMNAGGSFGEENPSAMDWLRKQCGDYLEKRNLPETFESYTPDRVRDKRTRWGRERIGDS